MANFTHAAVSPAERGELAVIAGLNRIRISSTDTGGALAVMETVVPCGEGQARHIHALEDEFLHVLKGRFGFWCGDEYVELEQGGCIALPRNVPHQFRNVGDAPGKLLVVVTPGGFENFFQALTKRASTRASDLSEIAAEFDDSFLAPLQSDVA